MSRPGRTPDRANDDVKAHESSPYGLLFCGRPPGVPAAPAGMGESASNLNMPTDHDHVTEAR